MPAEQPQIRATIGNVAIPGAVAFEVLSVAYFCADRFMISFAIGLAPGGTIDSFLSLGGATITVEVAAGGTGFVRLITGIVGNVRIDLAANVAVLTGRDLAARLIDTEIQQTFSNQTASQIAVSICERHEFTANITTTNTPVGQYYLLDHARSALALFGRTTTEWNLLSALAETEGFSLSVTGTTLNFGPPSTGALIYLQKSDFSAISFDVLSNLPSGVTVKSWNGRNKTAISATVGQGPGTTLIRPNMTAQLAQTFAAQHWRVLTSHAVLMEATMPGELTLQPGMQVVLDGTSSGLDQVYAVSAVRRTIDAREGFAQHVTAYGLQNSMAG